jgi:hypothetical protein
MKRNILSEESLTKRELVAVLNDFRKDIQKEIISLKTYLEIKLDELEFRMEDQLREHRSEIFTKFDSWAGELETAREDRVMTTKQLKKLEKIQN